MTVCPGVLNSFEVTSFRNDANVPEEAKCEVFEKAAGN